MRLRICKAPTTSTSDNETPSFDVSADVQSHEDGGLILHALSMLVTFSATVRYYSSDVNIQLS